MITPPTQWYPPPVLSPSFLLKISNDSVVEKPRVKILFNIITYKLTSTENTFFCDYIDHVVGPLYYENVEKYFRLILNF